jgi:Predicted membrane protein
MSYLGLFLAAFLAATLLPAQSETVLVALLLGGHPAWLLVLVASAGNILGSLVNWWLGRGVAHYSRPALVPGQAGGAGAGTRLVRALRTLVAAAELGAHHWRSADPGRRRDARTAALVPAAGGAGQGRSLSGAGRGDPALRLSG